MTLYNRKTAWKRHSISALAFLAIVAATAPASAKNDKGSPAPTPAPAPAPTPKPAPAPTPTPTPSATPPLCSISDIGLASGSCSGFFAKNLLKGSDQSEQYSALFAAPLSFSWDKNWSAVDQSKVSPGDLKSFSFKQTLYGDTIIGIHFGAANGAGANGVGVPGGATAFYRFNAGLNGLQQLSLKYQGLSSAVIYKTGTFAAPPPPNAVPEPATWAMMILGFALAGAAARRSTTQIAARA